MFENVKNFTNVMICTNRSMISTNIPKKCTIHVIQQNAPNAKAFANQPSINVISSSSHGLSKARNEAINLGKKLDLKEISFTDDDCILDSFFAINYQEWKIINPHSKVIFGTTLPHHPTEHTNRFCPCTFIKKQNDKTSKLGSKHWEESGLGNNMTISMDVFDTIGKFKPWLGAGSIGLSGEDAEFSLRCMIAGIPINYCPNMVVYHNKWLTMAELRKQWWRDMCGGVAAYAFYGFQGKKECWGVVKFKADKCMSNIKSDLITFFWLPWQFLKRICPSLTKKIKPSSQIPKDDLPVLLNQGLNSLIFPWIEITHFLRGILIAFIYAKIIPIPSQENVVKISLIKQNNSTK